MSTYDDLVAKVTRIAEADTEKEAHDMRSLVPVEVGDIMTAALPAPPFVIEGLVPRRVVTLLAAHGGAGKSNLALALCAHVAGGAHSWAGHLIEDGHAAYFSLEDPADVVRYRLRHIIEAYGLDAEKIARRLHIFDGTGADPVLAYEQSDLGTRRLLFTAAMEELEGHCGGVRLVALDNASDAFDGGENDRRMVRAFVRRLARLARDEDAGLILLAHVDKASAKYGGNGQSFSGSTAWHNSSRSRLAMTEGDGVVTLAPEKLNLGRKAEPIALQWTAQGVLMPIARSGDTPTGDDAGAVLAAMQAAAVAGVDVGAARTGPTTTQTVLSTFDALPERLRGARGRNAFWTAVGQLIAKGAIAQQEIVTGQRNRRKVLVCVSSNGVDSACVNPPHPLCVYDARGDASVRVGLREFGDSEPTQTNAAAYRAAKGGFV